MDKILKFILNVCCKNMRDLSDKIKILISAYLSLYVELYFKFGITIFVLLKVSKQDFNLR